MLSSQTNKNKKTKTMDTAHRPNSAVVVKSRFVECPAGCGRHVLEKDINDHLDRCVSIHSIPCNELPVGVVSPNTMSSNNLKATRPASSIKMKPLDDDSQHDNKHTNAFSHMMKRSAKVFSALDDTKWAQRFHLNANGTVCVTCYCTNPGNSQPTDIVWSTNSQIKAKSRNVDTTTILADGNDDTTCEPKSVDLALSSAIPSSANKIRLVDRHSKLSIPVLKSILQKAIRRRKSLPAVRVAMELADKSLGDLLRRLPIIMLEDSTLHPSFPLLTWLMAAHSKNFEPTAFLLTKILCAVYEMASCRWHDRLSTSDTVVTTRTGDPAVTFDSYHKPGIDHLLEDRDVYIWSMLVRARYGGMGCDIEMLDGFVKLWSSRFKDDCNVPASIQQRLGPANTTMRWSTLPVTTHETVALQSFPRIEPLVARRLPVLAFADITTEGVDFHCSSVLDDVMADPWLFQQCIIQIGAISTSIGLGPVPPGANEKRTWLERTLKRCMWNYSAGVNRRLPLTEDIRSNRKETEHDPLKAIWQSLILPKTTAFAENYVTSRLTKL
jgi:hypothetical protein